MPKPRKPISEMTNLGGIGAAIAAREARLSDAAAMLKDKQDLRGHQLTDNKAMRLRHVVRTLEAELAELYERRTALANATAQRAPSSALSDWE